MKTGVKQVAAEQISGSWQNPLRQRLIVRAFLALAAPLLFVSTPALAQNAANYTFSTATNGSLTQDMNGNPIDMNTGTTKLIPAFTIGSSGQVNIGFDFWFMGTRHTIFNVATNGLMGLSTAIGTGNNIAGGTGARIGAFVTGTGGSDMATNTNGKVHYRVFNAAPGRVLVTEWLNMRITSSSPNADATFQVRLYETTGVIEFVYGMMSPTIAPATTAIRVGLSTNTVAPTFNTVLTSTNTNNTTTVQNNSYGAGTITNLHSLTEGSRRFYRFTPAIPASPTNLIFTNVTGGSMTLNWTDNSTDELGFAVYRSEDGGATYNFVTQIAAGVTNAPQVRLLPNTTYPFRVMAVSEGGLSAALAGSQATTAAGTVVTGGSGNWSSTVPNAPWPGGIVPTAGDHVTIADGQTVTINVLANCLSLTIGQGGGSPAVLQYTPSFPVALNVGTDLTINSNGTFKSADTGTEKGHLLTLNGDLVNNGTFDGSTNSNQAGFNITFDGSGNSLISGNGPVTDIQGGSVPPRGIFINKQNPFSSVELNPTNFTVNGVNTDVAPCFSLTRGEFKLSGIFPMTNRAFATPSIPVNTAFCLNNPNFTVAGQAGNFILGGDLTVSQGIFIAGLNGDDRLAPMSHSTLTIEGGTVNVAGSLSQGSFPTNYSQIGGVVNLTTVGNTSSILHGFDMRDAESDCAMSGGTIVVRFPSSGVGDFRNTAGTQNITGGTLKLGDSLSGTAKIFKIQGTIPSLEISDESAGHTGQLTGLTIGRGNALIKPSTTLDLNNNVFNFLAPLCTNNGAVNGSYSTKPLSRFNCPSDNPQTLSGNGTWGTPTDPLAGFGIDNPKGITINTDSSIYTNRVNLFRGTVNGSNRITIGNPGSNTSTIQTGPNPSGIAGNFAVPPTFNLGSGGLDVLYLQESSPRTTGYEIPPNGELNALTVQNSNGVSLAQNLVVISTISMLIGLLLPAVEQVRELTVRESTNVQRQDGYMAVKHTRENWSGTYLYHLGTPGHYTPVNMTKSEVGDASVEPISTHLPFFVEAQALKEQWVVTATGSSLTAPSTVTGDLTFNYAQSDVNGDESIYSLYRINGSTVTEYPHNPPNVVIDTVNNTAFISGVELSGTWTLAEAGSPTAIRLVSFAATVYEGGALLKWQTGFESDNLGFNIYREEAGNRVPVNKQLIAGSALRAGSTLRSGGTYAWWDASIADCGLPIEDCKNSPYWLEDIDLNGDSTWHGPFYPQTAVGNPPAHSQAALLTRLGANRPQAESLLSVEAIASRSVEAVASRSVEAVAPASSVSKDQTARQSRLASQPAVKISIKREGLYRISQPELVRAGLPAKVDPRFLQLFVEGREVPITVLTASDGSFDDTAGIEFYGMGLDTPFTDSRTYWLVGGDKEGKRIGSAREEGVPSSSQTFTHSVERKDRSIYFSALRNGERENFFGAVVASSAVEQTLSLPHLHDSAPEQAFLEVSLQGVTIQPHRALVELNGFRLGEVLFRNQEQGITKFTLPHSMLREGANAVRLVSLNGPGDVSLIDYLRIDYQHTFTAVDDALRFSVEGNERVTLGAFSSKAIRVFDVTDEGRVTELKGEVDQAKTGYSITVAAAERGKRRLLALTDEAASEPYAVKANLVSNWRSPNNKATFVIIAPSEFFPAIEPLSVLRRSQGHTVALIDIEDVYDEFNFGNKSTQSIKDLLSTARTSWKVRPGFVMFAADASFDARNYLGPGSRDIVPTRLVDTAFLETASDDWLADFDNDGIADLAVGRLPAGSIEEATSLVRKIVGYDSSKSIESVLLVSDANDGFDFEGASKQLQGMLEPRLRVEQLQRGRMEAGQAKARLMDAIARGQKIINYTGHGSANVWRGNLLTSEEARELSNESLPLMVMMTCLNGYFHDATLDSLAESLIKTERGGAVAVWSSSGLTFPREQAVMNQQFYRIQFETQSKDLTLGEAVLKAKHSIGDLDTRRTWILLGDPTMQLR